MSLVFRKVSFAYSGAEPLFRELDLSFQAGEFAAVIGPNGSGKSSLLKLGTGLLQPDGGQILLNGSDLAGMPHRVRARQLATVFQLTGNAIPYTVQDVVRLGRIAHRRWWEMYTKEDQEAVFHAMASLDIAGYAEKFYSELSGGEQQRVLLAAALAQKPQILLLDEPTSALDLGHKFQLLKLLKDLADTEKIGIVMISHDLALSARYAGRMILLDHGRILADGAPQEVVTGENIRNAYHCDVTILNGPAGEPVICGK